MLNFCRIILNKIHIKKKIEENIDNAVDVKALSELKATLDASGVYKWGEVKDFGFKYTRGESVENLSLSVDVMVRRFKHELDLKDGEKADFKIKAMQFVNTYVQLASTLYSEIRECECLFWFLKLLLLKLNIKDPDEGTLENLLNSFPGFRERQR